MAKKRRLYPEECMTGAIKAVREGMSIRSAAAKYNVPNSTLLDKLSGRSPLVAKIGRNTTLTACEEKMVVEWILKCRKRGMPPSKDDILNSIQDIIMEDKTRKTPFTNNRPGRSWLQLFLTRHPILTQDGSASLRRSYKKISDISSIPKSTVTEDHIRSWFDQLKEELEIMDALDVLDDPSRVFSTDENNIELCAKTGKVIGLKVWQNVYEFAPGPDKSTMSFLRTLCANGEIVSPTVVYPFTSLPSEITDHIPEKFTAECSESGWIKAETFRDFLAKGFLKWLVEHNTKRPVILFVNGKTTHITVQLSELCEANEIILYLLPNNALDLLMPARLGNNKPFKSLWKEAVTEYHQDNSSSSLRRSDVAPLLDTILNKMEAETIINSFALSGLCPFDPDMVNFPKSLSKAQAERKCIEEIDAAASSQSSRYADAKAVLMELIPRNKLSLMKKNQGEKGLRELWQILNEKVDAESRDNAHSHVMSSIKYDMNDHVVIALDPSHITNQAASDDSTSQFTYVVFNQ